MRDYGAAERRHLPVEYVSSFRFIHHKIVLYWILYSKKCLQEIKIRQYVYYPGRWRNAQIGNLKVFLNLALVQHKDNPVVLRYSGSRHFGLKTERISERKDQPDMKPHQNGYENQERIGKFGLSPR